MAATMWIPLSRKKMVLSLVTVSTIDIQGFHGRECLRLSQRTFFTAHFTGILLRTSVHLHLRNRQGEFCDQEKFSSHQPGNNRHIDRRLAGSRVGASTFKQLGPEQCRSEYRLTA